LLVSFLGPFRKRKQDCKGILLVWHADTWVLWWTHNNRIFNAKTLLVDRIFYKIQLVSWTWLLVKKLTSPRLFYEWCVWIVYLGKFWGLV
jgi:hypothetical protein